MRLGRFLYQGQAVYGLVEDGTVYAVAGGHASLAAEGSIFKEPNRGPAIGHIDQLKVLVPCQPGKVLAIGPNFHHPGREFPDQEPQIFIKPDTSLIGSGDPIMIPWMSQDVIHEPELAVVMGSRTANVSIDEALDHVLGYTCANDVTAKDWFARDRVMAGRSKIFDTFCPLGPVIATDVAGDNLGLSARVNGELQVTGHTSSMVWSVAEVVSFISCILTLHPGDVILMAAPGIGPLQPGDVVEVEIEGIGILRNPVVATDHRPVRWQKER